MLKLIEDITVISADEFLSYEGEMIFVDTECPFKSQPLAQVYLAIGDIEDSLPSMWQESSLFAGGVFTTYESGVLHTFISLELQDQLEPGKFLFIKVISIGEPSDNKPIRIA
jgi:hypothetical protein